MPAKFQPGDFLIYKKQKHSPQPGPRAHDIAAEVQDGHFKYVVDKFWIVADTLDDGTLVVQTRRGKRHHIKPSDPNLRRATWWQRLLYRSRFRQLLEEAETSSTDQPVGETEMGRGGDKERGR